MLSGHDGQIVNLLNVVNINANILRITEIKRDYCNENIETCLYFLEKENLQDVFLTSLDTHHPISMKLSIKFLNIILTCSFNSKNVNLELNVKMNGSQMN